MLDSRGVARGCFFADHGPGRPAPNPASTPVTGPGITYLLTNQPPVNDELALVGRELFTPLPGSLPQWLFPQDKSLTKNSLVRTSLLV
jgi:hypothetical protein